jgi:hypothetical protein
VHGRNAKAEVHGEAADTERRTKTIQQKLDRLVAQSIDIQTYEQQRDKLRQELTLTDIDGIPPKSRNSM